ncbi:phosphohydrolase [Xanthomonas phage BUDD]|nr:phosphohydrolase [Xanthomonas phage BUDD]
MQRDFIETWSGVNLYMPDPDPESILIEDIAHALSKVCRFAGHVDRFYSVAEHSIHVSYAVPPEHALQALLHDATEAYLCDIPTPFKRMIPAYAELEDNLWAVIAEKYGVPFKLHETVKLADRMLLLSERDALKEHSKRQWPAEYENHRRWEGFYEMNLTQEQTARVFLLRFAKLASGE